jgi:hypothetical protein
MHHSKPAVVASRAASKQKWQEPKILVERSLNANAQEPDPQAGPLFGPFSTTNS